MLQNFTERRRRRFTTWRSHGYSRPMHIVLRWIAVVSCENTDPCWYVCFSHTSFFRSHLLESSKLPMSHLCHHEFGLDALLLLTSTTPFPKQQLNTYQLSRDALKSYLININTTFSDSTKELSRLVLLSTKLPCGKSTLVISLWDLSKAKMKATESFPLS